MVSAVVCSAQSVQFYPASPVNTTLPPLYVLSADLNNDGFSDLVIVSGEGNGVPSSVYVFLGNGDGTFKPAASYSLGTAGSSTPGVPLLGQTRLTGPNLWDIIIPMTSADVVNVLLGKGDGTFQAPTAYPTNPAPTAVSLGQFNFATLQDLVVTSQGNSSGSPPRSSVSVLPGHSDGTFGSPIVTPLAEAQPSSIVWADFNKDFNLDVAVGTATGIAVLLSTAEGIFQPETDYALPSPIKALALSDFNNDHNPDLAAVHGNVVSILLGKGDGTFQAPANFTVGNGANAIVVFDFDGDGKLDLIVSNGTDDTFSVLPGNGDGSFQPAMTFPTPGLGPTSIQVTGFNSDGAPDVAVTTSSGATIGTPGSTYILLNSRGTQGTLNTSSNPACVCEPVTFTAKVTPTFPGPTPTGQVAFYFDFYPMGNAALDATGTARITTGMGFTLPNIIRASYLGDKNYDGLGFPAFIQNLVDFDVTPLSPSSVAVAAGGTAQFTFSVILTGTFNNPVNFSCAGAPPNSTCSISPNSLPVGTASATVTVSVKTSGTSMASTSILGAPIGRSNASGLRTLAGLIVLVVVSWAAQQRRPQRWSWLALATALLAAFLGSCGGGSSGAPKGPVTPAGTYTLTLSTTSATANINQSQSLSVTVTN
jgi:hypothetical protein